MQRVCTLHHSLRIVMAVSCGFLSETFPEETLDLVMRIVAACCAISKWEELLKPEVANYCADHDHVDFRHFTLHQSYRCSGLVSEITSCNGTTIKLAVDHASLALSTISVISLYSAM